jgi:hypothetical protein
VQQRIERAGRQAVTVVCQLFDHPLAVNLLLGRVVANVQADKA